MPTSPSHNHPKRDSWPPTVVRIQQHADPGFDAGQLEYNVLNMSSIDNDPMTYFLTPTAPMSYNDLNDDDDLMVDFDAGIEDAKRPPPIVRSVSPSTLDGLRLPLPRPPTPPRHHHHDSTSTPRDLYDDAPSSPDGEDYIRFAQTLAPPVTLREFADKGRDKKGKGRSKGRKGGDGATSSGPWRAPPAAGSGRGRGLDRPASGGGKSGHARGKPIRVSPHAWREPSPDVWAIEEAAEEEDDNGGGKRRTEDGQEGGRDGGFSRSPNLDITAAKPRKRVRFVLPPREVPELVIE